ncbi:ADP-ribosylglycohydrolase family protein [Parasphingorhabdus pacifica]
MIRLDEAERALLATWREFRRAGKSASRLDSVEWRMLETWRLWRRAPTTRPPWAAALQHQLSDDPAPPVPTSGLAGPDGFLAEAPSRFLGMLLGGAVGESVAQPSGSGRGERTSATMFALESLIRAHTGMRTTGSGDPVEAVLRGFRRWLHTRGVPWADCAGPGDPPAPDGWLLTEVPRGTTTCDSSMVAAIALMSSGRAHGTPHRAINRSDAGTTLPLGALAALWSADEDVVFDLGSELTALTHGLPHAHLPAGLVGGTVRSLLRGSTLVEGFGGCLARRDSPEIPHEALLRALRLGANRPPSTRPGRVQLDAMGAGRSGADALGIAIRVAIACSDDFAGAVRIAAEHGGDTGTTAMLCGQLLGAVHGPSVIPDEWLDTLPMRATVERLAADATTEFGPYPDETEDWFERYPGDSGSSAPARYRTGLAAVPRLAATRDRFLGAVLGGAIGEALGGPITGDSWSEIQDRHGEQGVRYYVPAGHPAGRLGSDTQLLLFSLEGTIRANVARRQDGVPSDPYRHVQHAYQRWLHTQHLSWARAAGEFLQDTPEPDGWLVEQRALFQTRNPGRTMMRTLIAFAKGQQAMGSPDNPVSDSKGSSAVMRSAPAALWSTDPAEAFRTGTGMAALTHGSPAAYLSAGTFAGLIYRLTAGEGLRTATSKVLDELTGHTGHEEVSKRLSAAIRLAESGPIPPSNVESTLGTGWTAHDALGIGVYAALAADGDFELALRLAVNHSGNSATTGAVCGSLLGALLGAGKIPERWVADLELGGAIERLTHDAALEFGPTPPDWSDRYPPT